MTECSNDHAPGRSYIHVDIRSAGESAPVDITKIHGTYVSICGRCGAFLLQDFPGDEFRPMTREDYAEWYATISQPKHKPR
jgi:hypothetical protein